MVVDFKYTSQKAIIKNKAFHDPAKKLYFLELDSMGFYKADSSINPKVEITLFNGNPFNDLQGFWKNENLLLEYSYSNSDLKDGIYPLLYTLKGDWSGSPVQGVLYLIVINKVSAFNTGGFNITTTGAAKAIYPYDKASMKKVKPEMKFTGETKTRTIGGERVKVYTSETGNEFGIYKDKTGYPYVKVITAKSPGVEEVPLALDSDGALTKNSILINVIDKKDRVSSDVVTGVVTDEKGQPMKDVKLRTSSEKEVVTNEKGEYTFSGLKSGEIITVERKGYKTANLQVNSRLNSEVKLEKAPLVNLKGFENVKLPFDLGSITEGINLTSLKNFMK